MLLIMKKSRSSFQVGRTKNVVQRPIYIGSIVFPLCSAPSGRRVVHTKQVLCSLCDYSTLAVGSIVTKFAKDTRLAAAGTFPRFPLTGTSVPANPAAHSPGFSGAVEHPPVNRPKFPPVKGEIPTGSFSSSVRRDLALPPTCGSDWSISLYSQTDGVGRNDLPSMWCRLVQ